MIQQGLQERFREPKGWLTGTFRGARGKGLFYGSLSQCRNPRAHLVYIEGLSEHTKLTYELARNFNDMACNFSVFDRHGQGYSPRHLSNPHKQHADGFDKDISDILSFCQTYIPRDEPVFLLGHSTGGLLAFRAAQKRPDLFCGIILTAPLFGIQDPVVGGRESLVASISLPRILTERYIPGGHDWMARNNPLFHLNPEDFSSDPERMHVCDYWQETDPKLRTGAPTIGWVHEACRTITESRKDEALRRVRDKPFLVLTAGRDKLVVNEDTERLTAHMNRCAYHLYQDSLHEILMETDSIRSDALGRIDGFLKHSL